MIIHAKPTSTPTRTQATVSNNTPLVGRNTIQHWCEERMRLSCSESKEFLNLAAHKSDSQGLAAQI